MLLLLLLAPLRLLMTSGAAAVGWKLRTPPVFPPPPAGAGNAGPAGTLRGASACPALALQRAARRTLVGCGQFAGKKEKPSQRAGLCGLPIVQRPLARRAGRAGRRVCPRGRESEAIQEARGARDEGWGRPGEERRRPRARRLARTPASRRWRRWTTRRRRRCTSTTRRPTSATWCVCQRLSLGRLTRAAAPEHAPRAAGARPGPSPTVWRRLARSARRGCAAAVLAASVHGPNPAGQRLQLSDARHARRAGGAGEASSAER